MTSPHSSSRRSVILGVSAIAALAGAGTAWWRGSSVAEDQRVQEPISGFWALQWKNPAGQDVFAADFKGRPLLINFWATWCPPCIEELPLLNDFYVQHRDAGWQVLGLAVDSPGAVRKFLEKTPLAFPVALAAMSGVDLGRNLGNVTGGLPFSVALSARGEVVQRKMGQVHATDLELWAQLK